MGTIPHWKKSRGRFALPTFLSRPFNFPVTSPSLWGKLENIPLPRVSYCFAYQTWHFATFKTYLTACPKILWLHSTLHTLDRQTLHSSHHTPHFSLYTAPIIHTLYTTLFHLKRHTPHSTRQTPHFSPRTLHSSRYTLDFIYTLHITLYTPHSTPQSLLFTPHTLQPTILSSQSTFLFPHTPHSTLYTFHSTLQIGNRENMHKTVENKLLQKNFFT